MSVLVRNLGRKLRAPFNKRSAFMALEKYHSEPRTLEQIVDAAIKFPSHGYFASSLSSSVQRLCLSPGRLPN
jgi:hypothetical protein